MEVAAMKPGRRALAQWRRRTEWPLVAAAALFLLAYAVPILHHTASPLERHLCTGLLVGTWAAFGVDYVARLYLDTARRKHVNWYVLDFLILVVPIFPFFRFLRVLRLLMLFRVVNRKAAVALQGRVAAYVGGTATLVILCGALAELDAERHSHVAGGPKIHGFGDAMWWAVSTVTTVGYGDTYPTTVQGRLVAVGLMFSGIALIGLVTASFASWLIARVRQEEVDSRAATADDLHALRLEITALRQELGLRSVKAAPPPKKKTG
jgi:voltage-gated potassium channel